MSAKPPEVAPEHAYFLAVEKLFITLRGAPLLLSPSDWKVTRGWYEQGIPFDVVEEALGDLFERRRAAGKTEGPRGLRYCRKAVEKAWERRQDLEAPARHLPVPPIDVPARLAALAAALPESLPGVEDFRRRLVELQGTAPEVEEQLESLDREVYAAAEAGLDPAGIQELTSETERALRTLAERLPEAELVGAEKGLRERLLRRRLGLPVLSLFAPEALPGQA